ncbi:unnamed protein product [Mytilus coruscus]|uniref:Uncharacterized protein n=1 Tax=Mytilus coruscus TaxID=42192 RepID=A0A6J8BB52_MYTCO|nr:unnamed protein product [Mytilus coruscus]
MGDCYLQSDITTLNNPSSDEFKDVKAGLERYWSNMLGTSFYSTAINRLTPTEFVTILSLMKISIIIITYCKVAVLLVLEIFNLTQTNELCFIRTTLSPCSSKLTCKVLNGEPSCVSKSSASTVNKGAIIGGVLGSIATALALAGAFYLHWKQRRA